jgi:hypothetical protein
MIVVADTSAVSNLLTIGREAILEELFGEVVVPPAVVSELLSWHTELPTFIVVRSSARLDLIESLTTELDAGEAEAIALAVELKADLLLIDERLGRLRAGRAGVRTTGLLGVLLQAKADGLLDKVRPVLDELIELAGFRISEPVRAECLRLAGE